MIEAGLKDYLCNDSAIAAIVGDRVTPEIKTEGQIYPCITYSRDGTRRDELFQGQSILVEGEFQIDAWGETYGDAKDLYYLITKSLRNFRNAPMGSVTVTRVFLNSDVDVYEHQIERFRSSLNVSVWFIEY